MATDLSGLIECRPGTRLWGPDDEDSVWHAAMDLFVLNVGNAYDALACLFGVRNDTGFRPLAENRGFPNTASEALRDTYAPYADSTDLHGTTWITWAELASADWNETNSAGTRTRAMAAGPDTHWAPVWTVMRTLSDLHGPDDVRLVVWFTC
ncbi:hypothetical protein [Streptomyces neyagawaensis]|uniref:hypothetical protein n=1 Tax=Streptomyces neyagawaensis TaxID=42238 RepID=UPI0006E32AEB|nr:hypothetical protein [Streptomyces neyagawaensis]MCL6736234.1 hypothetical protein [Streptomyces neyagawaensis]MDE1684195.1 hypothetical protein [Streptomyces neyagawaensis]